MRLCLTPKTVDGRFSMERRLLKKPSSSTLSPVAIHPHWLSCTHSFHPPNPLPTGIQTDNLRCNNILMTPTIDTVHSIPKDLTLQLFTYLILLFFYRTVNLLATSECVCSWYVLRCRVCGIGSFNNLQPRQEQQLGKE
jgi:hypothetical protein